MVVNWTPPIRKQLYDIKYDLTHFIRIPLSTIVSRPQISKAYRQIMDDPVAARIPREAFRDPKRLYISIGELNLPTPSSINAAIRYLHNLDLNTMLREALQHSKAKTSGLQKTTASADQQPGLIVKIHGLAMYKKVSLN